MGSLRCSTTYANTASFHQPPRKKLHCYAYAGSSFFTAGLGEGPKNASGITDEWW